MTIYLRRPGTAPTRLPCRRSRVRAPSSAPRGAPGYSGASASPENAERVASASSGRANRGAQAPGSSFAQQRGGEVRKPRARAGASWARRRGGCCGGSGCGRCGRAQPGQPVRVDAAGILDSHLAGRAAERRDRCRRAPASADASWWRWLCGRDGAGHRRSHWATRKRSSQLRRVGMRTSWVAAQRDERGITARSTSFVEEHDPGGEPRQSNGAAAGGYATAWHPRSRGA